MHFRTITEYYEIFLVIFSSYFSRRFFHSFSALELFFFLFEKARLSATVCVYVVERDRDRDRHRLSWHFSFSFISLASTIFFASLHVMYYYNIFYYFYVFSFFSPFLSKAFGIFRVRRALIVVFHTLSVLCCHYHHRQHQLECRAAINDIKSMTRRGWIHDSHTLIHTHAQMDAKSEDGMAPTVSAAKCEMNDDDFTIDNMHSHSYNVDVRTCLLAFSPSLRSIRCVPFVARRSAHRALAKVYH